MCTGLGERGNIVRPDERSWLKIAAKASPLPPDFYLHPTEQVALELLGCLLVHDCAEGLVVGRIVETEAYLSEDDPGCHAARGRTERNAPMYEGPGTIYVYQIYGVHYCLNLVTQPESVPEAVLLRAVEPLAGIAAMQSRRGRERLKELASGPAKLVEAFGIGPEHNRGTVTGDELFVAAAPEPVTQVLRTTRIGLAPGCGDDLPLRFLVADCPWISRPPRADITIITREGESPR